MFVAVGHQGVRLSSPNGIDWQHQQTGKEGEVYLDIVYGAERFVAVGTYGGSNLFAVTENGQDWKTTTKDGKYSVRTQGIGFDGQKFWATGGDPGSVGDSKPVVINSADGNEWSDYQSIVGKNILRRITHGDDLWVGVGDRGRRSFSKDGLLWQDVPNTKAIDTLVDVGYGNGMFVGVGLHGLRMSTRDGLTWTDRQVGEEGQHLNTILWADDRFVAIGTGVTYTSTDGSTWQQHANDNPPLSATYGDGVFVGAAWKGRMLHSTDAVRWRQVFKCAQHVEALSFGKPA